MAILRIVLLLVMIWWGGIHPSFFFGNNDGSNLELPLKEGNKTAYKNHYKGSLHYRRGDYKKALQHFQKAFNAAPDNRYFAMSYGVALAQSGKAKRGQEILVGMKESSGGLIREKDLQEEALLSFFTGMSFAYGGRYDIAIPNLKSAISLLDTLENSRLKSLFYNALGYALVLDQGKGAHKRADIPPHYHIHTRDLLRAKPYFEKALFENSSNAAAWHNYALVCDSLNLDPIVTFDSSGRHQDLFTASAPSLLDLPTSILSAFEFDGYDEILMMLDNSGSMVQDKIQCQDTTRFAVMKATALELLRNTPNSVQLGIGTIGGDCDDDPRLWHQVGVRSRRDFRYDIEFLVPDGTTPLLTMLQESVELFSDQPKRKRVMFLISDGANVCNADGVDICEWVENLASKNITIHILTFLNATFANTEAFAEYTCLAEKTNGEILYLDDLRCNVRFHPNTPIQECQPKIPNLQRVDCWGKSFNNLWAIFEEDSSF